MSFVVAIIGRYGVGKSQLSECFAKKGAFVIDVEVLLRANFEIPQYNKLQAMMPILSSEQIDRKVIDYVCASKDQKIIVVLFPSFLDIKNIVTHQIFDHVLTVDCSFRRQKQYLEKKGASPEAIEYLLQSGYDRNYYTGLGSDIFLNSVSLEHMEWVVSKILHTYHLIDAYK